MQNAINRKWLIVYSVIMVVLAAISPGFHLTLSAGNPDFGMTPITLAAVCLPWPIGVIAGVAKGVGAFCWTGGALIELAAVPGDILTALFTAWLVKRMHRSWAVILGQLSRFIITGGAVAIIIGSLVAFDVISPGLSPIGNLTSSAWQNIVIIWKTLSYPVMAISIGLNMVASLFLVWLFGDIIDLTLYRK